MSFQEPKDNIDLLSSHLEYSKKAHPETIKQGKYINDKEKKKDQDIE